MSKFITVPFYLKFRSEVRDKFTFFNQHFTTEEAVFERIGKCTAVLTEHTWN